MTAPQETKDKAAAVGFIGAMALAAGPVGLVVAALAVGIERAWAGVAGRDYSRERSRQAAADHRLWLAEDAAARTKARAARRAWLDAGGDPATEPARPSSGERCGRWVRRQYARAAVAAEDFRAGFREGLAEAKRVKARGGGFTDIVRARPDRPGDTRPDEPDGQRPPPAATKPAPTPPDVAKPNPETPSPTTTTSDVAKEGPDPMTTAVSTAQQGEANHEYVTQNLNQLRGFQGRLDELVDAANAERQRLMEQTIRAKEHAVATGQPAATLQALDEAIAYLKDMERNLSAFAAGNAATAEQVGAADTGLDPARQADDALRAAGADGRAVAPASGV